MQPKTEEEFESIKRRNLYHVELIEKFYTEASSVMGKVRRRITQLDEPYRSSFGDLFKESVTFGDSMNKSSSIVKGKVREILDSKWSERKSKNG